MLLALILALSVSVYWRTAYPTITWWDSSQYSLAAATMGVAGPPGSLLLTLLGWPVAQLPFGSPARALNLLAGVFAALSAGLVYLVALSMLRQIGMGERRSGPAVGAALGALTFAFAVTTWEYAVQFTPYILTTVFTGFILWTMVQWWRDADDQQSWKTIALLALLFGLDFSVHRTNALLIPGALAWIAVRRPDTFRRVHTYTAGVGGMAVGHAFHLLLIPIARTSVSPLWNKPKTLSAFWDYVSLEQLGGGFLLQLLPRKSAVWSVQVWDLARMVRDNFLHWDQTSVLLGVLAAAAFVSGIVVMWRRERRLGAAFMIALVTQAALTILYFNIPANYFRSLDRHYLPVCVTLAVGMAVGMGWWLDRLADLVVARGRVALFAGTAVCAVVPMAQLLENWDGADASRRTFAGDYARNALQSLPPDAIYFTVGDNDTFPALYLQAVEGVRPDVDIVNLSVASIPDFPEQLRARRPAFPLSMNAAERAAMSPGFKQPTLTVAVEGSEIALGVRRAATADSVTFSPAPMYGTWMPADAVLFDIVRTNRWRRPITFAITVGEVAPWLKPFARLDGLYWRIVPAQGPIADIEVLKGNVRRSTYRGFADPSIVLDGTSRMIGTQYAYTFEKLVAALTAQGDVATCRAVKARALASLPPDRMNPPGTSTVDFRGTCDR
jgi:hypothetical protein